MKKSGQVIFGVLVSVMTVLFACTVGFAAPQDLKIGSNKVGSTWYVQAACIADAVKKAYPGMEIDAAPIAGGIDRKSVV